MSEPQVSKVATTAAAIAIVSLSLPVLSVAGIHIGLLAPMAGFGLFAAGAVLGGLVSIILGVAGSVLTRGGADPDGRTRSLTAIAGGVALLGVVALGGSPGAGLPSINDITTDLADPPAFAADPAERGRNMTYPADFVPQVEAAYPDLQPHAMSNTPADAFSRALAAADELGWKVTLEDADAGTFEARDATTIFQFVDDVAVRIRSAGGGSVLDIRSKSRDGQGDLGANAARIRAFLAKL
ncbi:MAG: DUF1499 domain-containing protein [Myxococcota bacterium]|nr:DUF1499 domain-containing protein [Myxococcota bacterium]